ncbi:hypothetical protein HDF16_002139 [Granulicella aggregans]|uniref:Uncharacterized protein n=1 Tax=Granulicella aggregans TaxID=474949 RepID=A0A7W7ZCW6_9BACT|nr:hypothetical protein [Granulicella aggregans]MBB5057433.1 hypothetical protein [Granulicella aggregans]
MTQQSITVDGSRNIVIQIAGDHNLVSAVAPPRLALTPWCRRLRPIKLDIDILDPACEAVPLVGRAADQKFLREWLDGDGIAVTVVTGRGGSGKTRLALDLLQHVYEGWDAGCSIMTKPADLSRSRTCPPGGGRGLR